MSAAPAPAPQAAAVTECRRADSCPCTATPPTAVSNPIPKLKWCTWRPAITMPRPTAGPTGRRARGGRREAERFRDRAAAGWHPHHDVRDDHRYRELPQPRIGHRRRPRPGQRHLLPRPGLAKMPHRAGGLPRPRCRGRRRAATPSTNDPHRPAPRLGPGKYVRQQRIVGAAPRS